MLQEHRLRGYFKRNCKFPVILIKMAAFVSLMLVAMAVFILAPGPSCFGRGTNSRNVSFSKGG